MKREIFISSNVFEKRIVVVEDGRLAEFVVERTDTESIVGNIYKGLTANVLPGMQSAFINIGHPKAGYLHISDIGKFIYEDLLDNKDLEVEQIGKKDKIEDNLKENDEIIVQVEKNPAGTKGAKLKTTVTIPGRFLVIIPDYNIVGISKKIVDSNKRRELRDIIRKYSNGKYGFILRTAAGDKSESQIKAEMENLIGKWERIKIRASKLKAPELLFREIDAVSATIRDLLNCDIDSCVVEDENDFDSIIQYLRQNDSNEFIKKVKLFKEPGVLFDHYNITDDIKSIFSRKVWLKNGGYLIIDQTEALTVIDVNSGKFVGKKNVEDTILKINMQAAEEIARQLRLRDVGGIVIVDFIDMKIPQNRNKLFVAMENFLKNDRTTTKHFPLTELSLMQITRRKLRQDIDFAYNTSCPICSGTGNILSYNSVFSEISDALIRYTQNSKKGEKYFKITVSPAMSESALVDRLNVLRTKFESEIEFLVNPVFIDNQFVIRDKFDKVICSNFSLFKSE